MLLRDIHEFIPAGSKIVLTNPVSFEFNPHLVQALAVDMDDVPTIRLLFNGGPVDLVFHPRKFDQSRLKTADLIQIKNSIWDVAMHASKALGDIPGGKEFLGPHADVRFGDTIRKTPLVVVPKGTELSTPSERLVDAIDGPIITPPMMDKLEAQSNEFDKLVALTKAYNAMPAVVDDDYPEMRHKYEGTLRDFIDALRRNGRLELPPGSAA